MQALLRHFGSVAFAIILSSMYVVAQTTPNRIPVGLISYPDLILYNGKIVTMDDASLNNSPGTIVQAMAIRGDRILYLGSNSDVRKYAGPATREIDLKGRTVVPGWIDTHSHMHDHAVQLWSRTHQKEIETIAKRFSVGGKWSRP